MDATEYGKVVLAAILPRAEQPPGSKEMLSLVLRRLSEVHFTDPTQRDLFVMCRVYLDATGEILPRAALTGMLRAQPPGTVLLHEQYYDALTAYQVPVAPEFAIEQLRELAAERMTGEALAQGMTILTKGLTDGKKTWRGATDVRDYMMGRFADIDAELHQQDAPEGDMRTELREMLTEYTERVTRQRQGTALGILTGINRLDEAIDGGLQPGELDLIGGFTTVGKTSFCVQCGWSAAVEQGRNVVIFTTETQRPQIRTKVICRHSRLPRFGLERGINSRDVKAGTANPDALRAVLLDFTRNPDYGRLYVAQVPRGATISIIEARAARLARLWPADLIIIDYLQLLRSDSVGRTTIREQQADIVKAAKHLATDYLDGRGVPILSPWQIGREGHKSAKADGTLYDLNDLSETHEAANSADLVITLQNLVLNTIGDGRNEQLKSHLLKNRDGARGAVIQLKADYATSYFEALADQASNVTALEFEGMSQDPFSGQ